MKYLKYTAFILSVFILNACQKNEVLKPEYDAASEIPFWDSHYYAQKNTDVVFLFDGDADFITFYSGEAGKEYQYKDRTVLPNGTATNPDKGTAIKSLNDNKLESYSYKYAAAGTYTATFVAINRTTYGPAKTVVVHIPVTIIP
ncbi:MAG: DUF5017 domain-containing protein [Chitinophagaceae bacterium]